MTEIPMPAFAVLDPSRPSNREMIAALGTDAVELESHRMTGPPSNPSFRVRFGSIPIARQVALCRLLARRHGISFDESFVTAVMGPGVRICACGCYVCKDPEVGREFFRWRDRERSGREAGP